MSLSAPLWQILPGQWACVFLPDSCSIFLPAVSMVSTSLGHGVSRSLFPGRKIMSTPSGIACRLSLNNSLQSLLARFLLTALPNFLPTLMPILEYGRPLSLNTRVNSGNLNRLPFLKISEYVRCRFILLFSGRVNRLFSTPVSPWAILRLKVSFFPWPCALKLPCVPPWCSCAF